MDKSREAFTRGLCFSPFDARLRLQRGRKFMAGGGFSQTIADLSLAARITPDDWEIWYYMSVAYNLWGKYEDSARCFEECARQVKEPAGLYPIVDWLFTTYVKLGQNEKAKAALELIDTSTPCTQMDYSYRKRVMLFKGEIPPETFIDEEEILRSCIERKDRPELEMVTQLYGLANYYAYIGEMEKSDETLKRLIAQPKFHNAFGYMKGVIDARDRGLID